MLKKNKYTKIIYGILGFIFIIFLIVYSYSTSKRKPANINELFSNFSWLDSWPKWLDLPIQKIVNTSIDWLIKNFGHVFDAINSFLLSILVYLKEFFIFLPWPLVISSICLLTWFASGKKLSTTILVTVCLFFIGFLNPKFWDKSMETLAIMLISIFFCLIIGIPIAISMSRSTKVRNIILPLLDLMQTIPSFCYLIPGIMLFGLGAVPAIIATFIYAVPPVIRLTDLGIRLVNVEIIEAAEAFGSNEKQKLFNVQLPLAMPNIMQGVNQTTMMALAMVVIASMIGTRGLGDEVLLGLQQLNVGRAFEAGFAIVLLAIVMDRITQSYGRTLQKRNHQD